MAESFAVVLAGHPADAETAEAVALAGGRVVARIGWDAPDAVEGRPVLAIEAGATPPPEVLAKLAALADAHDLAVVATFDEPAIDVIAATLMGPRAQLLCGPTLAERVAALALAGRWSGEGPPAMVREDDAERLRRLDAEVARLAALLARLTEGEQGGGVGDRRMTFGAEPVALTGIGNDPQAIRRMIRVRRLRDQFFPDGLFEDPAWDMLLDLHAAALEGAQVSVSSLCIAAAVAPTTGLRWIGRMIEIGLFVRTADARDRRRAFVTLSEQASGAMRRYFAALERTGLPPA